MKYAIGVVATAIFFFMAAPAGADEIYAVTPSGTAESVFAGVPSTVIGQLSSKCIDVHWTVVSSSGGDLVCESPLNTGQSILGQVLMGNSYSTPPRRFIKFSAVPVNGVTRVQMSGWIELQMAFGQVRRTDLAGAEFQNSAAMFLTNAGGTYPVGTTFPHHAYLGIDFGRGQPVGKGVGIEVTGFKDLSVAQKAGIAVGDIVTSIAGKTFKDQGGLLDAMAKATKSATYPVEVLRGGKKMTFTLERSYRPTFSEPVVAAVAAVAVAAPATAPAAATTVADELAKLAKLKADGVLTEAEFQAQKAKLLN